jgi:hypothetical protein
MTAQPRRGIGLFVIVAYDDRRGKVMGAKRSARAMNPLDDYRTLRPGMRNGFIGQFGTQDALKALGTDGGIAWLEAHIESPVGLEWGLTLFELQPSWHHLDRWIRLNYRP